MQEKKKNKKKKKSFKWLPNVNWLKKIEENKKEEDKEKEVKMQQTNGVTTVISQEQSDLVTSATISAGGQKDSIKNGKTVIITNNPTNVNINKNKITTLINSANNSKSSSNTTTNINNNNSSTTNKNNSPNKTVPNGRSDVIVTNLQHKLNSSKKNVTISETASNGTSSDTNSNGKSAPAPLPDARAKQVLKEAVDAVVNSFTKHTQGYGRGEFINLNINLYFHRRDTG